jgi:hypothetical protein
MTRNPLPIPVEPGQVRRDPNPHLDGVRWPFRFVTVLSGPHMMSTFRSAEAPRWEVKSSVGRRTHILASALELWPVVKPRSTTPETTP